MLYHYKAVVRSVYDGDTVRLDIDLGCGVWLSNQTVRLYGINAPEVRGLEREEGIAARDALRAKIDGKEVEHHSIKDKKGKYGRYLSELYLDGISINSWLVDQGHAEYKEY